MKSSIAQGIKRVKKWRLYCERNAPYYPYPLEVFLRGFCEGWKKGFGDFCLKYNNVVFRDNGWAEVYHCQDDFGKLEGIIFPKVKADEFFVRDNLARYQEKAKELESASRDLEKADVSDKENSFKALSAVHMAYIDSAFLAETSTWGGRAPLARLLKDYLLTKTKPSLVNDYFSLLASPREPSFVFRERQGLLRIAKDIERDKALRELFQAKSPEQILHDLKGEALRDVRQHTKAFEWLVFDYSGPLVYDELHFVSELKAVIEEGNVEEQLSDTFGYFEQLKQKQDKVFAILKVDKKRKRFFGDLQIFVWHKDFKKETCTKANLALCRFTERLAKERKVDARNLLYITSLEMEEFVLTNKLKKEEIEKRKKLCVVVVSFEGTEVLTGTDAEVAVAVIRKNSDRQEVEPGDITDVIKGQVASGGRAEGVVKLALSPAEAIEIQKGMVLVTGMTTPAFIPAARKASAIITDEGGITCHAAIVSRELGIPCIIGTKIATQALKDGDIVEVDANKGIVKVVQKTK